MQQVEWMGNVDYGGRAGIAPGYSGPQKSHGPRWILAVPAWLRLADLSRRSPPRGGGSEWAALDPGYEDCVAIRAGKTSDLEMDPDEVAERREWLGYWEPDEFDLADRKKYFDR